MLRRYTMVHGTGFFLLPLKMLELIQNKVPGVVVKHDVWHNGSSMATLLVQRDA